MFRRRRPEWARLASGFYVPPYLKFAGWYPCCLDDSPTEDPDCEWLEALCDPDLVSSQVQVTITNVVVNPGFEWCADCPDWNDTYVLDYYVAPQGSGTYQTECSWYYLFPEEAPCSAEYLIFSITKPVTNLILTVAFNRSDGSQSWTLDLGSGAEIDCTNINYTLDEGVRTGIPACDYSDVDSSEALVSSV